MPRQPTLTGIHLNDITTCLNCAVTLLKEINDAFPTPFIQPILNATLALITTVPVMHILSKVASRAYGLQTVKRNKDECVGLMENIHKVLYAIINLHISSETAGFYLHPSWTTSELSKSK
jgi:hypothetical protein